MFCFIDARRFSAAFPRVVSSRASLVSHKVMSPIVTQTSLAHKQHQASQVQHARTADGGYSQAIHVDIAPC